MRDSHRQKRLKKSFYEKKNILTDKKKFHEKNIFSQIKKFQKDFHKKNRFPEIITSKNKYVQINS